MDDPQVVNTFCIVGGWALGLAVIALLNRRKK